MVYIAGKVSECRINSMVCEKKIHTRTQKQVVWVLKIAPKGYGPQFSKLEPDTKMTLQADSSNCFHSKSIEIDEKWYNDPI